MRRGTRIGGRTTLALALMSGLGACASGAPTLIERIGAVVQSAVTGPEEAPPPVQMTRAELEELPYAIVALSKEGGPRVLLVPLSDNGGYVNYRDAGGDAVIIFGGAVSGTESLGYDLQGVRHHPRDPVAYRTPLDAWPGRVQREYQYAVRDLGGYSITLDCVFELVARETIEIIELTYGVARVSETCTNAERQITNTYWVAEQSGFIWKSEQWIGPRIGHVTVEVIKPYAG